MFANVKDVVENLCPYKDGSVSEEEEGKITTWYSLFQKAENDQSLDNLCKLLSETFGSIEQLLNSSGVLSACVRDRLKQLQAFLDLLLNFDDCYLKEFVAISKTVSLITHVLANVLVDLFTKGFGISKDAEDDGSKDDISEAAKSTGMGDGVEAKDISDQIEDEDQLRGTDKKVYFVVSPFLELCMGFFSPIKIFFRFSAGRGRERAGYFGHVLSKDKGIEMSDEFDGK